MSGGDWPAYWWWRDGPVPPGDCVIVDIDGVLADAAHRQHHLDGPWRDWDSFFADMGDDDGSPRRRQQPAGRVRGSGRRH